MRFPRVRLRSPSPVLLSALALAVLALAVVHERSVSGTRARFFEAAAAYQGAIATTKARLSTLLGKTIADQGLTQNLKWGLGNTVKRSLKAKLIAGELEQIQLFDEKCRTLAQASFGTPIDVKCPLTSPGKGALGSLYWIAGDKAPIAALTQKVADLDSGPVYALGLVELGRQWLELHPELKRWTTELELEIGTFEPSALILVEEGKTPEGRHVATLGKRSATSMGLIEWAASKERGKPYRSPLFWPSLVVAIIATIQAWLRERTYRLKARTRERELVEWAKTLTPLGSFSAPGREDKIVLDDGEINLKLAQRYVSQALQTKIDALRTAGRKREVLESEIKRLQKELQDDRRRLAELAELDSLAIQLKRTTGAFLTRMNDLHSTAEDLSDLTDGAMAEKSQTLVAILKDWRQGIAERGSRKFIRGLAETAGSEEGKTLLDEQLEILTTLGEEIRDQALSGALMAHRLVESAESAVRIAGLWHGLALRSEDEASAQLSAVIEDAQALLVTEGLVDRAIFANRIAEDEEDDLPALPRTIWVAALYHVYLAMAELARETDGARIATRLRKDGDRVLFVVSVVGGTIEDGPKKKADKQAYHLDVSRSILAPYDVKVTVLPTLSGPFPVALAWQASEAARPLLGGRVSALLEKPNAPEAGA